MQIKMVDLHRQYLSIKTEIDEAIQSVLTGTDFIMGSAVCEFEADLATYLGAGHAVGCASGTDALQVAMMALGISRGDEVITSPFTFVATAETIALLGASPVYVDIDAKTYNLDVQQIAARITSRTKAIIPVHLYGQPADLAPLLTLAAERGLKVIEDTAQAIGARCHSGGTLPHGDGAWIEEKVSTRNPGREQPPRHAAGRGAQGQAAASGSLDRGTHSHCASL